MKFEEWLAKLLGHDACEVHHLLKNETAIHFLVAWSLFESKCFKRDVNIDKIKEFSLRIVNNESFDTKEIGEAALHFHERYQDDVYYDNLRHKQDCSKMKAILKRPFEELAYDEIVYLVAFTAYRYRNNIFHGNKGVHSWLQFTKQIELCTSVLQQFVSHDETLKPTLKTPAT